MRQLGLFNNRGKNDLAERIVGVVKYDGLGLAGEYLLELRGVQLPVSRGYHSLSLGLNIMSCSNIRTILKLTGLLSGFSVLNLADFRLR